MRSRCPPRNFKNVNNWIEKKKKRKEKKEAENVSEFRETFDSN